jgi:O-antigen ligase
VVSLGVAGVLTFATVATRARFAALVTLVALTIGWFVAGDIVTARFSEIAATGGWAAMDRFGLWRIAWRVITEHPITGIGLAGFREASEILQYSTVGLRMTFRSGLVAHNTLIGVWAETGIIGAGLFVAMLGLSASNLHSAYKLLRTSQEPAQRQLVISMAAAAAAFLVMANTLSMERDKLLWLILIWSDITMRSQGLLPPHGINEAGDHGKDSA